MSVPSTVAAVISQLLQAQWTLTNPAATDILWTDTKSDLMQMPQWTKNYAVGVYSPPNPVSSKPLCRELWEITENVYVDIYVKVTGTVEAAAQIREAMRDECYRIVHTQEFQVPRQKTVGIVREPYKIEGPEAIRLCLQIAAVSWDIRQ
jgi:hypothetical protein